MSTKHRTLPALEEDYQVLSDTVREFADEVVAPVSAELDAQHEFPYEIVAQMGEMGPVSYTHLTLPTNREV